MGVILSASRIAWSLVWVLVAAIFVWMGLHNLQLGNKTGWIVLAIAAGWLAIPALFFLRERSSLYISLGVVACFALLLIVQTVRRMWFIVVNRGMDSATEPGSPMAFLIGWIAELICLGIPIAVLLAIPILRRVSAPRPDI